MKFKVTMKDPDGPYDCINDQAKKIIDSIGLPVDIIDQDMKEELVEKQREKLSSFTSPWLEFGEYVTIEFDTEAGTAKVLSKYDNE